MDVGEGGGRRRRSMSDEKINSSNLHDYEDGDGRNSLAGRTGFSVLAAERRPSANRTLLDIIRDDPNGGFKDSNKKSWKSFKDKLRLRRAGDAWTSTVPIPASDVPISNNYNRGITRRNSTRFPNTGALNSDDQTTEERTVAESNIAPSNRAMMLRRNSSRVPSLGSTREGRLEHSIHRDGSLYSVEQPTEEVEEESEEEEEETEESAPATEAEGEPPVRMSLMALLAETDREMGLDGSAYTMDDDEEDEEEEEEENGGDKEYNSCCVCMVRHKGAAFIPCGHTFCRLCSRELWVQRGNCPLCNGFILEILDIF